MAFYQSIADYYDYIFPFNPAQRDFVLQSLKNPANASLLDVGCGTGSLSIALAPYFKGVTAIDPDESMLDLAIDKAGEDHPSLSFHPYGMLDIESNLKPGQYDMILCFGNTLVHLSNEDEIRDFLAQAKEIMNPGGKLLIQIINYDRIFDQGIKGLPTIENDEIQFVRNYHFTANRDTLNFETILSVKKIGEVIRNSVRLYPIRKKRLHELLEQTGFGDIRFYGNFKMHALGPDSIPLVVEASC